MFIFQIYHLPCTIKQLYDKEVHAVYILANIPTSSSKNHLLAFSWDFQPYIIIRMWFLTKGQDIHSTLSLLLLPGQAVVISVPFDLSSDQIPI